MIPLDCGRPVLLLILALVLPGAGTTLWARSSDVRQPLHIEADQVRLDERNGVGTYTGNVYMKQGTLEVRAERIEVHAPGKVLDRVVAEGGPATLDQVTDEGKAVHAEAARMEYFAAKRLIILTTQAKLWQEGNEFRSDRIEYLMAEDRVSAGSDDPQGRVKVIILPQTLEEAKPSASPESVAPLPADGTEAAPTPEIPAPQPSGETSP